MKLSNRGEQWKKFADDTLKHIENYTVPQYRDAPHDQAEGWTFDQCIESIRRYCNRAGTNAREGEQQRDLLKIAHYACLAAGKYREEDYDMSTFREYCNSIGCTFVNSTKDCIDLECEAYGLNKYLREQGYKITK